MHVVEVRRGGVDFVAAMAQMRTWFDNQGIQPSLFEIAFLPGRESRFRLQFKEVRNAVTFASSFDGGAGYWAGCCRGVKEHTGFA